APPHLTQPGQIGAGTGRPRPKVKPSKESAAPARVDVPAKCRRQIFFRPQPALVQLHKGQPKAPFIPGLPTHIQLAFHQHLGQPVALDYLEGLG
ncbi:MAG: hypothetical protein M1608_03110, partial [Candidatus Omnitrophica bacterium]|nr:hypothetical protein [Candidatus Omnitrophota bacterium]